MVLFPWAVGNHLLDDIGHRVEVVSLATHATTFVNDSAWLEGAKDVACELPEFLGHLHHWRVVRDQIGVVACSVEEPKSEGFPRSAGDGENEFVVC